MKSVFYLVICLMSVLSLNAQLTGTLTIGPAGDYTSIFSAIQDLNSQGTGAPGVTFLLDEGHVFDEGNFYAAITVQGTETGPIVFRNSGTPGVNNPVLTRTDPGTNEYGIRIDAGAWITFNGLDIQCTAAADPSRMEYGYWIDNGAHHITVKNCTVQLNANNANQTEGIKVGTTTGVDSGFFHHLTFLNNTIRDCLHGYWIAGNVLSNHENLTIGTESGGSHTILMSEYPAHTYPYAIRILNGTDYTISDVEITSTNPGTAFSDQKITGISNTSDCNGYQILNNHIHDITCTGSIVGMTLYGQTGQVYGNRINGLTSTNTSTQPQIIGIEHFGSNVLSNNMIWDLAAPGSRNYTQGAVIGIDLAWGMADVYYNTVYLDYTVNSYGGHTCFCCYVSGNADLRNNIFVNNADDFQILTPLVSTIAALGSDYDDPSVRLDESTNNNLYYAGTPGSLHHIFFSDLNHKCETLADYQALVGPSKESGSITELPTFVSDTDPYDLHISTTSVTGIESGGFPVVGIATDIDGDLRDFSHPDIGADEGDFLGVGSGGGGTGNGGYYYASTFGGIVPFDWQLPIGPSEITGLGDDNWSGWLPLPFTFRFFGVDYTEFGISSNGLITLAEADSSAANQPIPDNSDPDGFIAWFWDDLDPSNAAPGETSIQYGLNDEGNLVITFTRYPVKSADANGWITAQVVLYDDIGEMNDRILLQYEDRGSSMPLNACTIGIEDHTGTAGIQYHYNNTGGDIFSEGRAPVAIMFGEDEETLPVTLSGMTATQTADGFVALSWITQSETDMMGYNILRSTSDNIGTAMIINPSMIPAENLPQTNAYDFLDQDVIPGGSYAYWIAGYELDGSASSWGPIHINLSDGDDDPEDTPPSPIITGLTGNFPNPFNPSTTIRYSVQEAVPVTFWIHDIRGRLVDRIDAGTPEAGNHSVVWTAPERTGSGVYLLRMQAGLEVFHRKCLLLK